MELKSVNVTRPHASTLDRATVHGKFAWIIDAAPGATLDIDAAHFASTLDSALAEAAQNQNITTVRDLLTAAFANLSKKQRTGAALAVFHDKGDGNLEYALVGNIEIHGFHHGGKEVATDHRLAAATEYLVTKQETLQRAGTLDTGAQEQLTTGLINLEAARHSTDYWLIDGSAEVIDHMLFGSLDGNRPFAAVTSGFVKESAQNPLVLVGDDPAGTIRSVHESSGRNSMAALVGVPKMFLS